MEVMLVTINMKFSQAHENQMKSNHKMRVSESVCGGGGGR